MLLPTMTLKELHRAVFADKQFIEDKLDAAVKEFKRVVLKAGSLPVKRRYSYKSFASNIPYTYTLFAYRRSDWNNPIYTISTTYNHDGGTTLIIINNIDKKLMLITPHLLMRLRERYLNNAGMSTQEVIDFLIDNYGRSTTKIANVVRKNTDKYDSNMNYFAIVTPLGVFYCEEEKRMHDVSVFTTYLSQEMLKEEQYRTIFIEYFKVYCEAYAIHNPKEANAVNATCQQILVDATIHNWPHEKILAETNRFMDEHPLYVL